MLSSGDNSEFHFRKVSKWTATHLQFITRHLSRWDHVFPYSLATLRQPQKSWILPTASEHNIQTRERTPLTVIHFRWSRLSCLTNPIISDCQSAVPSSLVFTPSRQTCGELLATVGTWMVHCTRFNHKERVPPSFYIINLAPEHKQLVRARVSGEQFEEQKKNVHAIKRMAKESTF